LERETSLTAINAPFLRAVKKDGKRISFMGGANEDCAINLLTGGLDGWGVLGLEEMSKRRRWRKSCVQVTFKWGGGEEVGKFTESKIKVMKSQKK